MNITIFNQVEFLCFWLVFSRMIGIVIHIPVFDNPSVPMMAKVLISLIISYLFLPIVQGTLSQEIMSIGVENIGLLTIFNILVGLVIGYLLKSIMSVFIAAGSIMTQQMGFSSVSYFDPTYVNRIGPIEKLIQWSLIMMILSSGALMPMFKGSLNSFETINTLNVLGLNKSAHFLFDFFKNLIISALILASPILFTNLLLNMVMGIIARTVPQMNILMVSFVVNIGIGLLVFAAISDEFLHVAFDIYIKKLGDWFQITV